MAAKTDLGLLMAAVTYLPRLVITVSTGGGGRVGYGISVFPESYRCYSSI